MSHPNKTRIAVASNKRSNMDLTAPHLTTTDWYQFTVAKAMELVPNQKIDVRHELFTRLEPLAVPTFGRGQFRNYAFWVPFRVVFPAWNDFITDSPHTFDTGISGMVRSTPLLSNSVLLEYLTGNGNSLVTDVQDSAYDFNFVNSEAKYVFTSRGRYIYKLLRSLGYAPIFDRNCTKKYSALPLLCLAKIYADWFWPAQYANLQSVAQINALFTKNSVSAYELTRYDLSTIFDCLSYITYNQSYLTSAWDNPSAPNNLGTSYFEIDDLTNENIQVKNDNVNAWLSPDNTGGFTQYALTALRSLSDYLKRHQLVGSRSIDRYLARFGIKLSSEKTMRSVLIDKYFQDIQFGDVTSTASTDGASLGDFAGKGLSFGDGSYTVDSNGEYGMFIVVTLACPAVDYYQGMNRQVMHTTKLDFFTPEFDALGTQAISSAEAYVPMVDNIVEGNELYDSVFGFTPRYAEYKVPYAMLTGDYALGSRNVGKDSWYLFRDLKPLSELNPGSPLVHDLDFALTTDSAQYDRIFNNTDSTNDHFNVIHMFYIDSSMPASSLYDTYQFMDDDKSEHVSMDVNGTTLN